MADKMMVGEAIRDSENLELEKVSKTDGNVCACTVSVWYISV